MSFCREYVRNMVQSHSENAKDISRENYKHICAPVEWQEVLNQKCYVLSKCYTSNFQGMRLECRLPMNIEKLSLVKVASQNSRLTTKEHQMVFGDDFVASSLLTHWSDRTLTKSKSSRQLFDLKGLQLTNNRSYIVADCVRRLRQKFVLEANHIISSGSIVRVIRALDMEKSPFHSSWILQPESEKVVKIVIELQDVWANKMATQKYIVGMYATLLYLMQKQKPSTIFKKIFNKRQCVQCFRSHFSNWKKTSCQVCRKPVCSACCTLLNHSKNKEAADITCSSCSSIFLSKELLKKKNSFQCTELDAISGKVSVSRQRDLEVSTFLENGGLQLKSVHNSDAGYDFPYELDYNWLNPFPKAPIPENEDLRMAFMKKGKFEDIFLRLVHERYCDIKQYFNLMEASLTGMEAQFQINLITFNNVFSISDTNTDEGDLDIIPRIEAACSHALMYNDPLIVNNFPEDPRFQAHPICYSYIGCDYYASIQLRTPEDFVIGTIDVTSMTPMKDESIKSLVKLAKFITRSITSSTIAVDGQQNANRKVNDASSAKMSVDFTSTRQFRASTQPEELDSSHSFIESLLRSSLKTQEIMNDVRSSSPFVQTT